MTAVYARSIPELLIHWLPRQRWYTAKGTRLVDLRRVGGARLAPAPVTGPGPAGEVGVEVNLIRMITADGGTLVFQVPLTYRCQPEPGLAPALVGVIIHPELGERWVYDGPHDPVCVDALLNLLTTGRALATDGGPGGVVGVRQRPRPPTPGPARVLRREQSNTSIVIGEQGPDPIILKLFRRLHPGPNPDVVVQTRLTAAGCDRVPRPVGWIEGTWPASDGGGLIQGHLAYACEFVTDGEDAWKAACLAAETDTPFIHYARELGLATAEVHTTLAEVLPTARPDGSVLARLASGLAGRVRWAVGTVPALEPFAAAALEAMDAVRALPDPPDLQQVHGDYHLGQVLRSPTRGWVLLDFEGEPLRPLAERLEPDLALRDLAGMLRSFDYASGHATATLPDDDPRAAAARRWSFQARTAFLAGYRAGGGRIDEYRPGSVSDTLLRALEIDKAMYEVVYETLNRPAWVDLPLSALRRLT